MAKDNLFKWIRLSGYFLFIPFLFVGGPLTGYLVGEFLQRKLGASDFVKIICIVFGLLAASIEIIRIIRIAIREESFLKK